MKAEEARCMMCGAQACSVIARGFDYDYGTVPDALTYVTCDACQHWYLNPRPALESAGEIYPANYYTRDGSHQAGALNIMGRLKDAVTLRRLRDLIDNVPEDGRVVDLGCGDGSLLLAIRRVRPRAELHAIDLAFSPPCRAALEAAGIRCTESPLEAAQLPADVDLVVMNQVIEHLWDVDGSLERIGRALRRGGQISVSTPNVDGYDARWFRDGAWGGYYFPRHLNLFNRQSLTAILTRHGLRVTTWNPLVAPLVWASTARALQARKGWPRWMRPRDANLAFLAAFTLLDRLVLLLGGVTSNQQAVAARD